MLHKNAKKLFFSKGSILEKIPNFIPIIYLATSIIKKTIKKK